MLLETKPQTRNQRFLFGENYPGGTVLVVLPGSVNNIKPNYCELSSAMAVAKVSGVPIAVKSTVWDIRVVLGLYKG